mgnify:FL=1
MSSGNIKIYAPLFQEALDSIPAIDRDTYVITDSIAARIDTIMKKKGISKKQLAEMTHKRPSEITKWLGGGHNFTCRTIALIQSALGEKIITIS